MNTTQTTSTTTQPFNAGADAGRSDFLQRVRDWKFNWHALVKNIREERRQMSDGNESPYYRQAARNRREALRGEAREQLVIRQQLREEGREAYSRKRAAIEAASDRPGCAE